MSIIAAEIPQLPAMQTFLLASALKSLNGISTFSASCGLDSETVSLTFSPEEDSELLFNSSLDSVVENFALGLFFISKLRFL